MSTLFLSIVSTAFGMTAGVLGLALVAALVLLPVIGRRLLPVIIPCILLALTAGYVQRLQEDVATLTTKVTAAETRADAAEADARRLSELANANAAAAKETAAEARRQADAYQADARTARSDADRFDLARQAAELAAKATECPTVSKDVHDALIGRPISEDASIPGSLRAAMGALRKGRKK